MMNSKLEGAFATIIGYSRYIALLIQRGYMSLPSSKGKKSNIRNALK